MTLTRDAASEKFTTALRKDSDELLLQVQVRDGMQVYKPGGWLWGCGWLGYVSCAGVR